MRKIPIVDDLDVAFPTKAMSILPPWAELPPEFKKWHDRGNKWIKCVTDWFYRGLDKPKWKPKKGVDQKAALRAVAACIGDWTPSHEHKIAGCAFLLSEWFDDVTYKVVKE